jgi:beta-fructofuranosidase
LGEFDGYEFTPMNAAVHLTDFAQDNYAGQFFYNAPGGLSGSVSIAWASNWLYTQSAGTAQENWRSSMSLPRQHSIRPLRNVLGRPKSDYVVVSKPYNLKPVLGKPLATKTLGNDSVSVDFSSVKSNALYFEAKMTNGDSGNFTVSFSSPVSGESLQAGAVLGVWNPVWINRGGLRGFDNVFYTDKFFVQPLPGTKTLSGVIDRSVFELFVNNGLHAGTATFFPKHPLTVMKAAGAGLPKNAHVELTVWPIKSVW